MGLGCRWILQPDKWGGAIELSILARHYGRQIAAYDIQTKRCDVYGQEEGALVGQKGRV
jgi:ubiquitin thioesterase OTU1